jgi:PAS domain S-box-containing protein
MVNVAINAARNAHDELRHANEQLQAEVIERQRAEQEVRESQQLLQTITDNAAAVIYVKDLEGRYLMVNQRFSELFHISSEDVVGKTDHDLFAADMADAFRAMDQRVVAADAPLVEEEVAPHDDGPHTYVSVKCPLRSRHGEIHGVFGISTDITERKRAEGALRDSEAQTRSIVDTALDAVVTMDGDGIITGWNRPYRAGYRRLRSGAARDAAREGGIIGDDSQDRPARCSRDSPAAAAWLVSAGARQVGKRAGGASAADCPQAHPGQAARHRERDPRRAARLWPGGGPDQAAAGSTCGSAIYNHGIVERRSAPAIMLDGAAIKRPCDVAAPADHGQKQDASGRIDGAA